MPSLPTIHVHAPGRTSRHEAAFTWVLGSVLELDWQWADDRHELESTEGILCLYGVDSDSEGVGFHAEGLLAEVGQLRSAPPLVEGPQGDPFAAVFWMGSRMEEWLPDAPRDEHGRFDPRDSAPEQLGWIGRPVCEQWAFGVGERLLGDLWPAHKARLQARYHVVPTLDVDSAFAFRGKGVWRTCGAGCRDILTGQWSRAGRRFQAVMGMIPDPYDTYDAARAMHAARGLQAKWFFLLADFGTHDKGLPANSPALAGLMQRLDGVDAVEWHPGYAAATDPAAMQRECGAFARILGRSPKASRQHYLRMSTGTTRRALIDLGVQEDHTEGHAVRTGFRGGFSRSRPWYDLGSEQLTELQVCPFAAMDATYLRYLRMAPQEVADDVAQLAQSVREVGGTLRLLWHNESLAPEGQWVGWDDVYPAVLDAALHPRA